MEPKEIKKPVWQREKGAIRVKGKKGGKGERETRRVAIGNKHSGGGGGWENKGKGLER